VRPFLKGKRELVARALDVVMSRPLRQLVGRRGLFCLTYHRVAESDRLDDELISCSPSEFEWQARWLKDNYRVLSGDEILSLVRGALTLREPTVAITFDDGYSDNLAAGETLARHGLRAIFFVTTGFVGAPMIPHWDRIAFAVKATAREELSLPARWRSPTLRLALSGRADAIRQLVQLWRRTPAVEKDHFVESLEESAAVRAADAYHDRTVSMSWDEVRRLRALGHTLGAHTHSHPILASIPAEEQRYELQTSKERLEAELGEPVRLLAYPNGLRGSYSDETKRLARQCGFEAAFSFHGGTNGPEGFDPFDLKRAHVIARESRALFRARATLPYLLARATDEAVATTR
jgi:peptidoglycan/xylan/chitin deacetylase (PgdA/CDA1 family)